MLRSLCLTAALLALPVAAGAAVLVDNSVDAVGVTPGFTASNTTAGQNFLSAVSFAGPVTITGFDIYSDYPVSLGAGVTLRVRNDIGGSPATIDLLALGSTITAIDNVGSMSAPSILRLHADFGPFGLLAGDYWFGMSGTSEIGFNLGDFHATSGANGLWQLSGTTLQFSFNGDTKAGFRVLGSDGATVPEPASWALLIAGFAVTGVAARRRRALAA